MISIPNPKHCLDLYALRPHDQFIFYARKYAVKC